MDEVLIQSLFNSRRNSTILNDSCDHNLRLRGNTANDCKYNHTSKSFFCHIRLNWSLELLFQKICHNAELREQLKEMANEGGNIDGIFQPAQDAYLGRGAFGFTYKGSVMQTVINCSIRSYQLI